MRALLFLLLTGCAPTYSWMESGERHCHAVTLRAGEVCAVEVFAYPPWPRGL